MVWVVKTVFRVVLDGVSVAGFRSLAFQVQFLRRSVAKRLMRSFFVVEREVNVQPFPSVVNGGVGFDVDVFVFDGAPQALGEDVVHTTSMTVHADLDSILRQDVRVRRACEVAALV